MILAASLAADGASAAALAVYEQRSAYRAALNHLSAGRTDAFKRSQRALSDYPLGAYLAYHELNSRLSRATASEIASFRRDHSELPVADIMHRRWLKRLGQGREWTRLLRHYEPTTNTELRCYYLRALYGTGKKEQAFAGVGELWVSAKSQPKSCDPLFDVWISNAQLTYDMAWRRLQLALDGNQRQLARYLLRFFEGSHKPWAQSLYNVHVDPSSIKRTSRYATDHAHARRVIRHGLIRLARRDSEEAAQAWADYSKSHAFTAAERTELDNAMMMARAADGEFPRNRPPALNAHVAEAMATAAVAHRNWPEALHWIEQLPAEALQSNRWQYWLARALSASVLDSQRASLAFRALANQRDYYGFLAAERIGSKPRLNGAARLVNAGQIETLQRMPAVARATELYAVGDILNARREINQLIPQLTPTQQVDAAHLVMRMGWVSQAIRVANTANLRDYLDLRFPRVYGQEFQRVSYATTVPHAFLIAVARQESAFDPSARSTAQARGLMQLLHSTAKEVARQVGLAAPTSTDLYSPHVNVELGGHHLADLLVRYDGSRPLAAAAYNAGRHRVDRWIKDVRGMPMDVWIETIPFRETRNYVKNVMAFAQVYAQLLAEPAPTLHAHEAAVP